MNKKGFIGGIATAIIIITVIILGLMCTERIPTGYVGVVYSMNGGVSENVLSQGWHIVSPTKKITTYSIGIEQSYLTSEDKGDSEKDESFNIPTSDGKTVKVNLEFSYRFDSERIAKTFTQFKGKSGEEVKNSFIKPKIIAWTQEVSATYPVTDIFGDKRTKINSALDSYLKNKFEPYGIIIDTVNFTDISVDDATAEAIQKKVTAQQELELANIEKEKSKVIAEQKKIEAEGEAEAKKISAEAEAKANKEIAKSLTPELIEKIKYEKWNGEVPQVQGSSTPIISLNNEPETKK